MSRPRDRRERTVPTGNLQNSGGILIGHAFEAHEQDNLPLLVGGIGSPAHMADLDARARDICELHLSCLGVKAGQLVFDRV